VGPVPAQMWAGLSPVPAQMWAEADHSRHALAVRVEVVDFEDVEHFHLRAARRSLVRENSLTRAPRRAEEQTGCPHTRARGRALPMMSTCTLLWLRCRNLKPNAYVRTKPYDAWTRQRTLVRCECVRACARRTFAALTSASSSGDDARYLRP
jgi:hypothetical protein